MRSLHSTQAQARGARAVCHLLALLVALAAAPALAATPVAVDAAAPSELLQRAAPSPLLAIDQNRATVVDRIVSEWGEALVKSNAGIDAAQLRSLLNAMRADHLLAASLAGNLEGLRNVVAGALTSEAAVKPGLLQTKALGDAGQDVVYVPVTPCRLVETRGSFAAVYQGGGAFAGNETRNYTLAGGNGVCLTQLPGSLTPSAIQLQVFGIPTTVGSGDIEILPQGGVFGSTTTLVYLGNNPFTSSAATSLVNLGNKQIGVQVRGGGAHVAIDVVGYFRPPAGGYVSGVTAGAGLTGGTISSSGTLAVDTAVIQSRVTGTCAAGSSIRTINANGTVTCEVDDVGGSGTVTSVATGAGLTGGPITGSGTIAADTSYLQRRVSFSCGPGSYMRAIQADGGVTCQGDNPGPSNAFVLGGNSFGAPTRIGTNDDEALDLIASSVTVLRARPGRIGINAPDAEHPALVEMAIFGQGGPGGVYANLYMREQQNATGGYLISVGDGIADYNSASFYLDQYKPDGTRSGQNRRLLIDADGNLALNRNSSLVSNTTAPLSVGTDGFTGNAAYLSKGGVWTNGSSRTFKEDFAAVDGISVLAKVMAMPITTWRYRDSNEGRHMGPIAEDFAAAFGLGDGDRYIGTIDGIGVALAAIQGLGARMDSEIAAKDARIAALEAQLAQQADAMTAQQREIAELRRAVEVMLARTAPDGKLAAR